MMGRLLLKSEDAAEVLGISRTHLYQLATTGEIGPKPIKLGKCALWNYLELRAWVAVGCPGREVWEHIWREHENRELNKYKTGC